MIGDDVVDLGDPAIADHHRRERFVARVCAADERGYATSKAGLWTLFAAKEAAYKALTKLGCRPGFAHREIVVARDLGAVRWRDLGLLLKVSCDDERVHAVAWQPGVAPPFSAVERIAERDMFSAPSPDEPQVSGRAARALACGLVAMATGLPPSELEVVRDPVEGTWDGYGLPRIEHRGSPLDGDVSLSHDGRFVSAAFGAASGIRIRSSRESSRRCL